METELESTEQAVKRLIAKYKNIEAADIHVDALLDEDLNIDSLGRLEVAFEIQNVFHIEIADDELPDISTVADIVSFVDEKRKKV